MRPRVVQIVALLGCVALIALASTRIASINAGRSELNIRGSASPVENAPPEYALAIQVFGAFRGLITDIAFIRAEQLKQLGRFYDAMQLHLWICKLQPHFPTVWEYASWNMAWNISVTTFTPEERWNWVYNGVKLLRDEGIPQNPRAINLYKQLAWTFNNKMGAATDNFHEAYKRQWAYRMHLLLGPPPDPLGGLTAQPDVFDEIASAEDVDKLMDAARITAEQNEKARRELAEERGEEYAPQERAPDEEPELLRDEARELTILEEMTAIEQAATSLDELYDRYPEARAMVRELRALGCVIDDDPIDEDDFWSPEGLAFQFFAPYRELTSPMRTRQSMMRAAEDETADAEPNRQARLDAILGVTEQNPAGAALVRFLQRKILLEAYRLRPEHMVYLIRQFGPIDWRAVDSQSLYWTSEGLVAGGETVQNFVNDKTNTARILFFSLRNLFHFNQIVFQPNPEAVHLSYLNRSVDPAFAESMHQAYITYGRLIDPDVGTTGGAGDTYRTGHINFLTEVIRRLYFSGLEAHARFYYDYLREAYPLAVDGRPNPAFKKPLGQYVMDSHLETFTVPGQRQMAEVLGGFLYNGYRELAAGNVTRYVRIVRQAERFHANYMEQKSEPGYERLRLPPFRDIQIDAFFLWLRQPALSEALLFEKVRLWQSAPLFLRQNVYDALFPQFESECDYWRYNVSKAFPEPPGMEAFREANPDRYQQPDRQDETDVWTPPQAG